MLYATPSIRWLQQQPLPHRNSLIRYLVEIELLAVAESHRTQDVGNRASPPPAPLDAWAHLAG
ncbi:hypothetical protein ACWHA6_33845 [Streptomyces anthocyanicus]|uniref:hypothetical protein n=1 Tax=Streptomyces TaxID=1883 RepID=UPI003652E7B9